jgi:hypothetical protein
MAQGKGIIPMVKLLQLLLVRRLWDPLIMTTNSVISIFDGISIEARRLDLEAIIEASCILI